MSETKEGLAKLLLEQLTPEMINPHFIKPEMINLDALTGEAIIEERKRLDWKRRKKAWKKATGKFPLGLAVTMGDSNYRMIVTGYSESPRHFGTVIDGEHFDITGGYEHLVLCSWRDETGELQQKAFSPAVLERAQQKAFSPAVLERAQEKVQVFSHTTDTPLVMRLRLPEKQE